MRLEPRPRLVDWALLVGLAVAIATGVGTMFAGTAAEWWIIALHGVAGLALLAPLYWKLRRERRHLDPRRWSLGTTSSILLSALALAAVGTGVAWALGVEFGFLVWTGLVLHAYAGLLLVPVLLVHLVRRFHRPRGADFEGRRTALQAALLLAGAGLAWRAQSLVRDLLLAGEDARRYTGSRQAGGEGNDFPYTSWVADDPEPVEPQGWRLEVLGAVDEELTLDRSAIDALATDERSATLDCTSGWYADRDWQGLRVGRLLEQAGPTADARWIGFRSVTGYRFSLPLAEAREALLATHVGGERLAHGHGFPLRLVAPGRRGYQWVKWVESVEVRREPDYGQWWAIFTSGFA